MDRIVGVVLLCVTSLTVVQTSHAEPKADIDQEHTQWIENALRSMQRIKVGDTRSELVKIFTTEGGLSNPSQRTYVYRHCPYIKIDVKFAPTRNFPQTRLLTSRGLTLTGQLRIDPALRHGDLCAKAVVTIAQFLPQKLSRRCTGYVLDLTEWIHLAAE
jgi:hypothetical protein